MVGLALGTGFRYVTYKRYVFGAGQGAPAPQPQSARHVPLVSADSTPWSG